MNYIVAVDRQWGIGKNNDLLFSLKGDMAFFRKTTTGATVIMGDRTLASLPGGQPLKNRTNVVMTLDPDFCPPPGVAVCHSVAELGAYLKQAQARGEVFVIGGATIYNLMEPYCQRAYITKVDAVGDADVFITDLDQKPNWQVTQVGETREENGLHYTFLTYENTAVRPLPAE